MPWLMVRALQGLGAPSGGSRAGTGSWGPPHHPSRGGERPGGNRKQPGPGHQAPPWGCRPSVAGPTARQDRTVGSRAVAAVSLGQGQTGTVGLSGSLGARQQDGKERCGQMHPILLSMLSISHLGYNEGHYLKLHDGSSSFNGFVLFYDVCFFTIQWIYFSQQELDLLLPFLLMVLQTIFL